MTERASVTAARWTLAGATALLVGLASGATALLVLTSTAGTQVPLDDAWSPPPPADASGKGPAGVLLLPGAASPQVTSGAGRRPDVDGSPRDVLRSLPAAAPGRTTGSDEQTAQQRPVGRPEMNPPAAVSPVVARNPTADAATDPPAPRSNPTPPPAHDGPEPAAGRDDPDDDNGDEGATDKQNRGKADDRRGKDGQHDKDARDGRQPHGSR